MAYTWDTFPLSGTVNFESNARTALETWRTNVADMDERIGTLNFEDGELSGVDITVGAGETLDVSAGTLTVSALQKENIVLTSLVSSLAPQKRDARIVTAHTDHDKVVVAANTVFEIGTTWLKTTTAVNVSTATDLDTGSVESGKDYCVYACDSSGSLIFKISRATTYPSGFTADTSLKIGGFHTLCTSVGTISGHSLSGYTANDIIPTSIWDLKHRPICEPAGMVYSSQANIWVDIYLQSGTSTSTASAYGGTITDTRTWMDHYDDLAAVSKQMLDDGEFQIIAAGSNEETNITGSADPVTTGGHVDTASRRMISNIGCEDCCGVMWQWLRDQSYRPGSSSGWDWYDLPGSKGSLYNYAGLNGDSDVKLLAGANWHPGAISGSRSRSAAHYRWHTSSGIGGRGRSDPR
jgi:hypothetical protein